MRTLKEHRLAIAVVTVVVLLIAVAILVPLGAFWLQADDGRAYYVDNQATTDGDGSLGSPWNNIADHIDALAAGDTMLIHGNATGASRIYDESEISCTTNGTRANPIVIRPYGSSLVTIKNAMAHSSRTFTITGDWWEIHDLSLDNDFTGGGGSTQIRLHGANHILIQGCTLTQNPGDGAILVTSAVATHVTIEDCVIHDTYKGDFKDSAGILILAGNDITITGCTIYNIRGDGVVTDLGGPSISITVEGCHIYTTLGKCSENGIDIKAGSAVIQGNVLHGFRHCDGSCGGSGGGVGPAIQTLNPNSHDVLIEDNVIYDVVTGVAANSEDTTIHGNLFYNLVIDAGAWVNAAIYLGRSDNHDTLIYNNTVVSAPRHLFYFTGGTHDIDIRNNIFYNAGHIYIRAGVTGITADYNGWFNATHRIAGDHDITGQDPLLTIDYRLTADSPARGAGEDGTDLGAFPYVPAPPIPTPTLGSPTATASATSTATPAGEWWEICPPDPTCPTSYPEQSTLTPRPTYIPSPTPTCRPTITCPPNPSPTRYPTATHYPTSTAYPPQLYGYSHSDSIGGYQ